MDTSDFNIFNAMLQSQFPSKEHFYPELTALFKDLDPLDTAQYFASHLYNPEFHSNILRLEYLIHCALSHCNGTKKITDKQAIQAFNSLTGTTYQSSEDPVEDVMVASISFLGSDYLLLEGLWESNAFYLQRFLKVLERMPHDYKSVKESVLSILKVSDFLVKKNGLSKYLIGNEVPLEDITEINLVDSRLFSVTFSLENLTKMGIEESIIHSISIKPKDYNELLNQDINHSELAFNPFLMSNDEYSLLLPTFIGHCIKKLIINECSKNGEVENLKKAFASEYIRMFNEEFLILGKIKSPPVFPIIQSKPLLGCQSIAEIDQGVFLNLIYIFDDFDNINSDFVSSAVDGFLSDKLDENIERNVKEFTVRDEFKLGLSLIVLCGTGRGMMLGFNGTDNESWMIETLSASDFDTFSKMQFMSPQSFIRFLKGKRKIKELGINLVNPNGLLNLFSWAKKNKYNIIPHESLYGDVGAYNLDSLLMSISTHELLSIRQEVYESTDSITATTPYGKAIRLQKLHGHSYFKEDSFKPIYASIDNINEGSLLGLIIENGVKIWIEPIVAKDSNREFIYKLWSMLCDKAYLVLVRANTEYEMTNTEFIFRFEMQDKDLSRPISTVPTYSEIKSLIDVEVEDFGGVSLIKINLCNGYYAGFHKAENDAERALTVVLVQSIFSISDQESESLADVIMRNRFAKSIHLFKAISYLDHFHNKLNDPILTNEFDDANLKLGLAWLNRSLEQSSEIKGKEDCSQYLNSLVSALWEKQKNLLKKLNKKSLIYKLMLNHGSINKEIERWNKTFPSMMAEREDTNEVYSIAQTQLGIMNASCIGSRIVIEMAICECSRSGLATTDLELTELVNIALLMHSLGGWSDGIQYEMVKPILHLSPTGDVLFDHSFKDSVIDPYGQTVQSKMLDSNSENVSSNFVEPEPVKDVEPFFEDEFNNAWVEHFGFNIDIGRLFVDVMEDVGFQYEEPIFFLSELEITAITQQAGISNSEFGRLISNLTLHERKTWDKAPKGYGMNDIVPWRFKRKLSLVSKPILKIGDQYLISPSHIRTGLAYLVRCCHSGEFDSSSFPKKSLMSKWIGHKNNQVGHKFNEDVARKFRAQDLVAYSDLTLSKMLNMKFPKDFGDVDVLAFDSKTFTVYLVECKDLEFAKTQSEIAKQAYEFRGVNVKGKPDRLLKHINRCNEVVNNTSALKRFLGVNQNETINIEVCLMFRNVVPMTFGNIRSKVKILNYDQMEQFKFGI